MALTTDQLAVLQSDLDTLKAAFSADALADVDTANDISAQTAADALKATHAANKTATAAAVSQAEQKLLSDAQADFNPSA